MSGDLDLEQRYRRVLRLLPGYYRDKWEEDMVAAFLDSWMTGDPDEDSVTMEYDRPSRQEIASVVALAARLYLGGAGTPRRYFAWGQAVRLAVLAVVLVHATQGLADLTVLAWRRHLAGWFPALPASLAGPVPGGAWPVVMSVVNGVWILIFVALAFGHHRTAQVVAAYQIMITLPAADVTAATAVVTTAYDSRGGIDFSVAGRTWALPMVFRPFRSQQLSIALPSKNQALQLYRLLVSSG